MALDRIGAAGLSEDQNRVMNDIELARSRAETATKDRELSGDKALGDMMAFGQQAFGGLTNMLGMVSGLVQQIAPMAMAAISLF